MAIKVVDYKAIWNAVFAAEMVATYLHRQNHEGTAHALKCLPNHIQDAECLADIVVQEFKQYKEKKNGS